MRSGLTTTNLSLQTVVTQVVNIFKQEHSGRCLNQKRESRNWAKEHGNADYKQHLKRSTAGNRVGDWGVTTYSMKSPGVKK
ncbi:unnamed protein product, partial [marine sediment metagenome]